MCIYVTVVNSRGATRNFERQPLDGIIKAMSGTGDFDRFERRRST